ncbi:MAG: hypothetical protein GY953_03405, partial [bacterium]|nr:hypothetical protein [bacterium]
MSRLSGSAWRGAVCGFLTWQIYAVAEAAACLLLPLARGHVSLIPATHWELTFLLFAAYGLLGILSGGVACAALAAIRRKPLSVAGCQRVAALSLVLAYLGNITAAFGSSRTDHYLAAGAGLILLGVLALRLSDVTSAPWVVIVALLGPPLLDSEGWKFMVTYGLLLAATAVFSQKLLDR